MKKILNSPRKIYGNKNNFGGRIKKFGRVVIFISLLNFPIVENYI